MSRLWRDPLTYKDICYAEYAVFFFFFKQKTAYEISACLVGSEMCIRDRCGDVQRSMKLRVKPGVELLFEPTLPSCVIVSDPNRLHQVVANFVNNAIKFTTTGSVSYTHLTLPTNREV